MNFMKKFFIAAFAFTLPLMSMQNGMDLKKALTVLGLADKKIVTKDEVEKHYRTLAKKWHPDLAEDKTTAHAKMAEINDAYDQLKEENYPLDVKQAISKPHFPFYPSNSGMSEWRQSKRKTWYVPVSQSEEYIFDAAVMNYQTDKVEQMLKKNKGLVHFINGEPVLFKAIKAFVRITTEEHEQLDLALIKLLIKYGADVNCKSEMDYGITILLLCARHLQLDIVQLLLDAGARLDIPDRFGETVLGLANVCDAPMYKKYSNLEKEAVEKLNDWDKKMYESWKQYSKLKEMLDECVKQRKAQETPQRSKL